MQTAINGVTLTKEKLEAMAKLIKGSTKPFKEQILDHYNFPYNKDTIDNIFLIMPKQAYLKEADKLEDLEWVRYSKYIKEVMLVDTTMTF